jgi:hypothetical protein
MARSELALAVARRRKVRCPNCAANVSALREFCPNCGTPTDPGLREGLRLRGGGPDGGRTPEELKRNRKTVFAIGGALLILGAVMGRGHFTIPHSIHIGTHDEPRGPVTIGAAQLFEAYHTNSHDADRRFGNREMVVSGQFVRTAPDGYGSIDMRLKTAHPDLPLGIDLDGVSVEAATKLEPGQAVTVSCRRVAGSGDNPWLEDCVIQPAAEAGPAQQAPAAPKAPSQPAAD